MDKDDEGNGGNLGGGADAKASNYVTPNDLKTELQEFKGNHDEKCDLKLGVVNEKIENMESRIKFAIYMSTAVVGLVLIMVQYYLVTVVRG